MSTWFYYDNEGHKQGPITGGQLKGLAKAGQITPGTMLETEEGKAAPARKVKGLAFATTSLATTETVQPSPQPVPEPTAPVWESTPAVEFSPAVEAKHKKFFPVKFKFLLLLALGLLIVGFILQGTFTESMSGYRRGFGDTILTYKNRSYEGTAWQEVSLSQLNDNDNVRLHRVIGWIDDDYWVIAQRGVFRYKNGTWTNPVRRNLGGSQPRRQAAFLLNRNSLFFNANDWDVSEASIIRNDGEQSMLPDADTCRDIAIWAQEAYYADNGFLYLMGYPTPGSYGYGAAKITFTDIETLGDKSTKFQRITSDDKEFFIHKDNNTVTRSHVIDLHGIVQIAPGKAIGIADNRLVEFRNGIWYEIIELPRVRINYMWVDCFGTTPKNAVIVGSEGRVVIHQLGGGNLEMHLPPAQEVTSMDLFRVWGNSIDKFWVMDTNGTVWERSGNDWRVVVRGLRREDVTFKDAWVSPTGTVFAITDRKLYQLK